MKKKKFLFLLLIFIPLIALYFPFHTRTVKQQFMKSCEPMLQSLYPEINAVYIDQNSHNLFSPPNQLFSAIRYDLPGDYYDGKISYGRNHINVNLEGNSIGEMLPQSFYYNPEHAPLSTDNLEPGKYYYYYGLGEPIPLLEFLEQLSDIYEQDTFLSFEIGIAYIPILTSDSMEDIALGVPGNTRHSFTGLFDDMYYGMRNYQDKSWFKEENLFLSMLDYLATAPLYADKITVSCPRQTEDIVIHDFDFQKRADFCRSSGVNAIGVVVFGDELLPDMAVFDHLVLKRVVNVTPT